MTEQTKLTIPEILAEAENIANDSRSAFGRLNPAQLNWKPGPDQWSVGQCFNHLIIVTTGYFPQIDEVIDGRKETTFWERLPVLPGFFGRMLIKIVSPQSARKFKAPPVFQPKSSDIDPRIIDLFISSQKEVVERIKATQGMNPERIIITSPAAKLITYSLLDAYRVIVTHERRHYEQARRVSESPGFPG